MKRSTQNTLIRIITGVCMSVMTSGCLEQSQAQTSMNSTTGSVLKGLTLPTLGGGTLGEKDLQGKVLLVVNVASQCGFTRQYSGLQKLHDTYGAKGFMVIGVPCNQFGGQEPGDAQEILAFTKGQYGVEFPPGEAGCQRDSTI